MNVSQPRFWCEPALPFSTVKTVLSSKTPFSAHAVRLLGKWRYNQPDQPEEAATYPCLGDSNDGYSAFISA